MAIGRGKLPDGDWIKTDGAADLYSRATGMEVDGETIRRWIRRGNRRVRQWEVWQPGREYLIERESILRAFESFAGRMLAVVEEERKRGHD